MNAECGFRNAEFKTEVRSQKTDNRIPWSLPPVMPDPIRHPGDQVGSASVQPTLAKCNCVICPCPPGIVFLKFQILFIAQKKGRACFSPAFFRGKIYLGRESHEGDLHPFTHPFSSLVLFSKQLLSSSQPQPFPA